MIYIVIGQSGAGKTTFVKDKFLKEPFELVSDEIAYTVCANGIYALGKYGIDKRTEGTDTLAYNSKEKIKKQIEKLKTKDIVLEGDRINNKEIFDFIKSLGVDVKLYLITCSLKTSMERLRKAGSTISVPFVKTTKTKSKNMYLNYANKFNGEIINTEEIKDEVTDY